MICGKTLLQETIKHNGKDFELRIDLVENKPHYSYLWGAIHRNGKYQVVCRTFHKDVEKLRDYLVANFKKRLK